VCGMALVRYNWEEFLPAMTEYPINDLAKVA
jgi:hypothetical protein